MEVNPDDDAMPVVFQMILVENIHTQEEERGREGSGVKWVGGPVVEHALPMHSCHRIVAGPLATQMMLVIPLMFCPPYPFPINVI